MESFQSKQTNKKKAFFVVFFFTQDIWEIEKASCSTSRIVCVRKREEEEGEAGIPLPQKPCLWNAAVWEQCMCNFLVF